MMRRILAIIGSIALVLAAAIHTGFAQTAGEVVDQGAFHGGVAVHVGCGNGSLVSEIHRLVPQSLVRGLSRNARQIQACRSAQFGRGTNGEVTFGLWDGATVPFVDDFVNLLVVSDGETVNEREIKRVLAPGGRAVLIRSGTLRTVSKSRPADIDEWTHYLHGVDNNPVAKDKRIRPPLYHLQWVGSPRWSRHHDVMSSVSACVSANNKVFYIFDEGLTFSPLLPPAWKLIARDAFNGTILWKRDLSRWFPNLQPLKSGPATLPRRLVAVGKRVYVTLDIQGPVTELNSDTGETDRVFPGTEGTEEILCDGGALYLVVDRNREKEELTRYPLVGLKQWQVREKTLVRVNLAEGKIDWQETFPWVAPMSMALDATQLYFHDGKAVRAISRESGADQWTSPPMPIRRNAAFGFGPSLVVNKGVVVYTGGENTEGRYGSREQMYGLSAKTGQKLWDAYHPASGYRSPEDLFVIHGRVWCGDVTDHRWQGERGSTGVFYGTDIATGSTEVEFGADKEAYWFHHRCHMAKATEDYLLISRTGIEFIDLENQTWNLHHWVRGACLYGIMPANGMVYAPQHPCACYLGAKLFGFNALKTKDADSVVLRPSAEGSRLVKGPAFGSAFVENGPANEWPTYRRDNRRSGSVEQAVTGKLRNSWTVKLPGVTTQPVIAGGRVLVSLSETQALYALDADSGETLYRYFPEGRIDSPPSVYGNRVYFGSTDGCVYCLKLDDGALVWKYQAAPTPVHHMYFERIESTHPVHGTVLVRDNKVYAVAGRSMFVDGGMRMLVLDAVTGRKIHERVMDDKDPETGEPLQMHHEFLNMPVALPDILSCSDNKLFMRFQQFDLAGNRLVLDFPRKLYGKDMADKDKSTETLQDQKGPDAHIFSATGFLDDTWWHRTYWIYGKHFTSGWPGYYLAGKTVPAGRILSRDEDGIYGWGRMKQYFRWSKTYQYMLFAADYDYRQQWARSIPILARAMVKAGGSLHVAGPAELVNQEVAFRAITTEQTQRLLADQDHALRGERGAQLLTVNAADGTIQAGYQLTTTPVFDAMASANGRLYIALTDGTVTCLGAQGEALKAISRSRIGQYNANSALKAPSRGKTREKKRNKRAGK